MNPILQITVNMFRRLKERVKIDYYIEENIKTTG